MTIIQKPSPNYSARPAGVSISCLVLHADASKSEQGTISWVQSPQSKVSYHYLIGRDGTVYEFVSESKRAWHAGKSVFDGVGDVNDYSVGVSFANDQVGEGFTAAAIDAGVELCADICRRRGIGLARITTHAAIAVPTGRKHDPGPKFPLAEFLARVDAAICHGNDAGTE